MALTFSFCLSEFVQLPMASLFILFSLQMSGWKQPVLTLSQNQLSKPDFVKCAGLSKNQNKPLVAFFLFGFILLC